MNESRYVLWNDSGRVLCRASCLCTSGEKRDVLIMAPAGDRPPPAILDRLAHHLKLKDELNSAWAARPIELVREQGRTMLVLEDSGGEPLTSLIGAPMDVGRFLRLAVGIAGASGQVHRRGLVHKDLKPAHILVDCADGEVRLTGFGIASRLPRERQTLEPPETIAGTLAYMAPEQTGRMNRSIDSRSDLYSLGVTFYQMLTGSLPFAASDPMEWVHCHIARKPLAPSERLEIVPPQLSRIVMKLLAKAAEERYQTAAGLERDLRRCLPEWEAHGRIKDFPLGEGDIPDRLLIPETLYGREREVGALLAAVDRLVEGGAPELVLVSGYSGIGKSSVVHELHKALVPPRALFASGKFDQFKRDIPYATFAQAFQSLIRSLLAKSEAELASWRDAFLEALEPNARLMADLIPELKLIIGDQPPVPELEPQQARSRFQFVFRRFIGVFAQPEHPLSLFLDDLQWLDAATLDLIEDLLTGSDLQHLMLIGAHRDNEVDAAHSLMRKLEAMRQAGTRVQEIRLEPLGRADLGQLIADALHCESERVALLTQLVQEKTGGNPFFVIQFLHTLAEEGLLAFDHDAARWRWDLHRIHDKGYTDNVVDLLVGKLSRLPVETRQALQQMACLGNTAETAMLAIVLRSSEEEVHAALWEAVRQALVERLDGFYKFIHDRVQEAAYSLIPKAVRAEVHMRIGRLLVSQTPPEKREEAVFEIVNQLNRGAALITQQEERDRLAEFNLLAGKRAKGATAYDTALQHFTAGRGLLGETGWEQCYRLTFDLELNGAECEYLLGELASAEERLAILSTRAQTTVDSAAVTCLRINLYTTLDQSDSAVGVGLEYLRRVDGQWSLHPTAEDVRQDYDHLWRQLGSASIEALLELPPTSDPDRCATMDVLTVLTSPALFTDLNLFRLVVSRMATLSLEHGNGDGSCLAYAWLGGVLGTYFGEYQAGFRFGRLGLDLVEKHGLDRFRARVYLVFAVHVAHWSQPLELSRAFLRRAFDAAQDAGDLSYAAYSCIDLITNRFATGDSLSEVEREAELGLEFACKVRFGLASDCITGQLRLIRMLRGLTPEFTSFNDAEFDEGRFEQHLQNNPQLAIGACWYWIRRLQASIYASDEASAIAAVSKAAPLLWTAPTQFELAEYHFYGALARAAHCDLTEAEERSQHLEVLAAHHKQLAVWAENCPATFANRVALVGAEIARLEGREMDALRLYEAAIRLAREHGFIQNEGLAHERAARFCMARGFQTIAVAYLANARHCYLSWGADGKVRQLEEMYPQLRTEEPAPSPASTIGAPVEHLDLATVIKVSQAISSEMVLEKLIDTLMRTAIEQAGAERGLLILSRGAEPRIEAQATTSGDRVLVEHRDAPVTASMLPETVLHYVLRARESVILDEAAAQSPFAADPYIRAHRESSILCLPLINRGKLIGVLYLENNLTAGAFAASRIAVLKLLASQAAISLENTRLYRDLELREAKIRGLVDANIIGICVGARDGRMIEANDALLRLIGHDRVDLLSGRISWMDLTPPEWRDRSAQAFSEAAMTGAAQPFEKEYFRKDGSRVPVLVGEASIEGAEDQHVAFVLDLTGGKRAEEAVRRSEKELRDVIETSPAMAWTTLPDGTNDFANHYWLEFTGRSSEDITGAGWEDSFHPADVATHVKKWRASLASGEPFENEARIRASDGEYRWFLHRAVPLRDERSNIHKWYGISTEIDDRKRAEALLAGEKRILEMAAKGDSLAQILESLCLLVEEQASGVLASILLLDGTCLRHGAAPNLPKAYTDSIDGALIGPSAGSCGTAAYRGEQVIVEDIATDPLWAGYREAALPHSLRACWSTPIFSSQAAVIATFAMYYREPRRPTSRDQETIEQITHLAGIAIEQNKTEEALRRSEAHLAEAQRLTRTGSWAYNALTRKTTYWSDELFRILELDPHEGPSREKFLQLVHPEDRDTVRKHLESGAHEKTGYTNDYRIVLADGTVRHLQDTGHPVFDASGNLVEFVGMTFDATERKRAEEALREVQMELAHANRVATMGHLTASIAHEVNQPIAANVINAQAALRWLSAERPDLEEVRQALSRIVVNGNRAGAVISRIRALIKRAPPRNDSVAINDAIREVIELTRGEATKNGVSVRTQLADGLPLIEGDRVQLQQVILNLVINAIEAISAVNEPPRELLLSTEESEPGVVRVAVQDSGGGLAPAALDRLFEAFYTTKPDGLGLGLSICRSIIEAHGGRMWVSANSPRGAVFQFTVPARPGGL
jgi:PAS domain S-box-containing protein